MASNVVLSNQEYKVVGTRPIRHDGTDKVTGRAQYSADIQLPGLLHGKILRSPHPHARIKSIDTSRALAMAGVRAVVTSAELPHPSGKVEDLGEGAMANPKFMSNNCLADGKVLYKGHAVAAVAAISPHVAEEALSLIDVEYQVLPPVMDVMEAMKESAPALHDRLATSSTTALAPGGLRSDQDDGPAHQHSQPFRGGRRVTWRQVSKQAGRRRGTRVPYGHGPPGLYRAPQRHRAVEPRRQPDHLVQQPGPFYGAATYVQRPGHPGLQDKGHPTGDRRRIRREAGPIP